MHEHKHVILLASSCCVFWGFSSSQPEASCSLSEFDEEADDHSDDQGDGNQWLIEDDEEEEEDDVDWND